MGWIKLDRKLLENDFWTEKPFSRGQAWVDLLLLANHEDKTFISGNMQIDGKRGCVYRSKKWLAERWGWSPKKVTAYLNFLQTLGMISTKTIRLGSSNGTVVAIEKYSDFQNRGIVKGTSKESRRNSEGIQKEHIQEDNKEPIKEPNKKESLPSAEIEDDDEGWQDLSSYKPMRKRGAKKKE